MKERRERERSDGLIFGTAEWESPATKEQARVWRAGSTFGEHVIQRIGRGVARTVATTSLRVFMVDENELPAAILPVNPVPVV
jgi:hypothetical protein